ncbi:putative cystathionine gamma-lyase 2 [Anoplophora glabripennis]|uniref:putative cystathionine gamma-lyase 2 n=1 Tax=Anoplophora glabripennis TaxID=217634 RepID=UPI000874BB49|nr:putative cystathionine gamma-lyase 2 [Anoplophora glabripennis]
MAAVSLLKQGDHILCSDDIYGGTTHILLDIAPRFGICTCHLDLTNLSNLEQAITPKTKLIWTENPTNPKQKVIDLCSLSKIAKEKNILVVTDNTFLSPFLQRPIELGVDISLLSLTKYMNGHSDVIMGSVCTNRKDLYKKLKYIQTNFGHVPCPFDCYQVIRGLKTLPFLMKKHQFNSMEIAKYLESHPKIESVLHPGLPSHPQYELFKSQTSGYSGMVSFYLKGGVEESQKFMNGLRYFTQAVSLGGYESLVEMPLLNSHHNIPEELQKRMKYTGNLIRMSVGLENVCDLIEDLENSLANM